MTERKKWTAGELNLVGRASKNRQAEDKLRADVWQKNREAELEAVVNRLYDGLDIPEIAALVTKAREAVAPFIPEYDRLFAKYHPAEFARARMALSITPGGILDPKLRDKVRRDAAKHLSARKAYMVANSATFVTETMTEATKNATDNPQVAEMLDRLAAPNRATPTLEPPGEAIGILAKLLPHPQEWGLAGFDSAPSPLLQDERARQKALAAPEETPEEE